MAIYLAMSILFWAIPFLLPIVSSSIDDYFYMFLTSGAYTGEPTGFTVQMGYAYSSFIAFLYKTLSQIEWYAYGHYFAMYLAYLSLIGVIFNSSVKSSLKYLLLLIVVSIQAYFEIQPHSANIAVELSFVASLLLLFKSNYFSAIVAAFFFFLSNEFKPIAVFIPLVILIPLLLVDLYHSLERNKLFVRWGICVLAFAFSAITTNMAYSTDKWSQYKKENMVRLYIVDNPERKMVYKLIQNKNDSTVYELMETYRMYDAALMNINTFQEYVDFLKRHQFYIFIKQIPRYIKAYLKIGGLWFFAIWVLCLWTLLKSKDKKVIITFLACTLFFLLENYYMMIQSRPKERYLLGMMIPMAAASGICLYHKVTIKTLVLLKYLGGAIFLTFSTLAVSNAFSNHKIINEGRELTRVVKESREEKVFLMNGTNRRIDFLHASNDYIASHFLNFGWLMHCPFDKGGTGLNLIAKGTPIVVLKEDNRLINLLTSVLRRQLMYGISPMLIFESESFKVIRFQSDEL